MISFIIINILGPGYISYKNAPYWFIFIYGILGMIMSKVWCWIEISFIAWKITRTNKNSYVSIKSLLQFIFHLSSYIGEASTGLSGVRLLLLMGLPHYTINLVIHSVVFILVKIFV